MIESVELKAKIEVMRKVFEDAANYLDHSKAAAVVNGSGFHKEFRKHSVKPSPYVESMRNMAKQFNEDVKGTSNHFDKLIEGGVFTDVKLQRMSLLTSDESIITICEADKVDAMHAKIRAIVEGDLAYTDTAISVRQILNEGE